MLLKQLKLQNIRSYVDQTINFSSGSTLLSGDIGSGKSTVLLAVEFALFGTSRPELPGELLLRKGSAQASVELKFILNNQEIIESPLHAISPDINNITHVNLSFLLIIKLDRCEIVIPVEIKKRPTKILKR